MKMECWEDLKAFALSLGLPCVEEAVSWGNPNLKAHGKMWCWWAPQGDADAPAFKVEPEELEFLIEADPETFFTTAHHRPHHIILMRPERFDAAWARANLMRVWRKQAPRRFLKEWDSAQGQGDAP